MSNLADRITDGSVIDMLDFGWWPAFNFADVFIILGGAALVLFGIKPPSAHRQVASL